MIESFLEFLFVFGMFTMFASIPFIMIFMCVDMIRDSLYIGKMTILFATIAGIGAVSTLSFFLLSALFFSLGLL